LPRMSALDLAQISACLASLSRGPLTPSSLPLPLLASILAYCDPESRDQAALVNRRFAAAVAELRREEEEEERVRRDAEEDKRVRRGEGRGGDINSNPPALTLEQLPSDVLLAIMAFLSRQELGRVGQTCARLRAISYSDCLWLTAARSSLGSNQEDPGTRAKSQELLGAREKVKVGRSWEEGECRELLVAVQSAKYMPRVQLESKRLWVSWGSKIWCHPRLPGGGVSKATSRVLRGHSDDVSHFVVEAGMVVSGGRDRSLCAW